MLGGTLGSSGSESCSAALPAQALMGLRPLWHQHNIAAVKSHTDAASSLHVLGLSGGRGLEGSLASDASTGDKRIDLIGALVRIYGFHVPKGLRNLQ